MSNFVKLNPNTSFSEKERSVLMDAWINKDSLKRGGSGHIIASTPHTPDLGDNMFMRIVKVPGSNTHRFPDDLKDIGQIVVDHQYRNSPHAHDKLCMLVYKPSTIDIEKGLHASELLTHAMPEDKRWFFATMAFIAAIKDVHKVSIRMLDISARLFWNEYLISDREPTFYQSRQTNRDIEFEQRPHAIIPQNENIIPLARARENNILFLTSQVFHRAAKKFDISQENAGKKRNFINIMYIPTRHIERYIR